MLQIRGRAGGTELTGTIYERGENPPQFSGAPDEDAAYVWICDEFYEVDSGGSPLELDDRELNVAFETPLPRGFDTKEQAVAAARDHVRTQFARIGLEPDAVEIEVDDEVSADEAVGGSDREGVDDEHRSGAGDGLDRSESE